MVRFHDCVLDGRALLVCTVNGRVPMWIGRQCPIGLYGERRDLTACIVNFRVPLACVMHGRVPFVRSVDGRVSVACTMNGRPSIGLCNV